jgi:hypothetical protein
MKTFNLVSVLSVILFLAAPTLVRGQNYRSPYGGSPANMGAPRTFLGLPLPQQWTGIRPASSNQYAGYGPATNNRNYGQSSPCANGNCATDSCAVGNCSTGNCSTGTGTNCQYTTRRPEFGQNSNSGCANGQCRLNQYPDNRSYSNQGYEAPGNWSPRSTRSNAADPFRGRDYQNQNDQWMTPPGQRNPVNDLLPSRYNSEDLDLRRPYFNNQSSELIDDRNGESSSGTRNVRAPLPAKRSLIGIPADRAHGIAQI